MPSEERFESPPRSPGTPKSISPPSSIAFDYEESPGKERKAARAAKVISQRALVSTKPATAHRNNPAKISLKAKDKIQLDTAHDTKQAWIGKSTATGRKNGAANP